MYPSQDDLISITQNILSTMISMEASPLAEKPEPVAGKRLTGCIAISGEWKGAVVIQSSEAFTRQAVCNMLQMKPAEVSDSDLEDVLSEITNMIGGNIKSLVKSPSFLSLPSVTVGSDFSFHLKGSKVLAETSLDCNGEQLDVLVCESVT
jgi:chemotaxis protein CheX